MKPIRLLSTSDLHFGNTRIDPDRLAANFRVHILSKLSEIDLMIVAGDFFDTALALSDHVTPSVMMVMYELLETAARHDVTLRFLRGTVSHERNQCQYFPILQTQNGFQNDLGYFDTIALEYIERFDLRLLYLPDDLPYPNADAVLQIVRQKLKERGWESVDYAVVHGYFEHVVPAGAHQPKITYQKAQFDFVKRYVLIGHVHTPSIVDNFIYHGSFDRLAHGEEEPKGFICLDDDGTTAHVRFVQNTDATPFITLDYTELTDDDKAMAAFCKAIESFPPEQRSHVRIFHPNAAWRHGLLKFVRQTMPHIWLSVKPPDDRLLETLRANQAEIVDFSNIQKPTEENLPALILEHGISTTKPPSLTEGRIRQLLRLPE